MLQYSFMLNALAAAGVVAVVAAVVGYFLILRAQVFAGHALSHVGFAGATGALLVGVPPLFGLLAFTVAAAAVMGLLGERLARRDVAIGMVLAFSLGLGMLFVHFYTAYAGQATALLFGNVLAVDRTTLWELAALAVLCLALVAAIARPLLFASLHPELAEAKGVPLRTVGVLFLMAVAVAVAMSAEIVGVLLVFALMVGPPAAAQRLTGRLAAGIALAVVLAVVEAWAGIAAAYYSDGPTSFWITAFSVAVYGLSFLVQRPARRPAGDHRHHHHGHVHVAGGAGG
jgi:zinc/manganese transport system permease protein